MTIDVTSKQTGIECPCCGAIGAISDKDGLFSDGQPLVCGCKGMVSLDAETEPDINIDDCDCSWPEE